LSEYRADSTTDDRHTRASDLVAYDNLSLRSPDDGRPLVTALSLSIPHGTRVLVVSGEEPPVAALFRATAGLWEAGDGRILRRPVIS